MHSSQLVSLGPLSRAKNPSPKQHASKESATKKSVEVGELHSSADVKHRTSCALTVGDNR